MHVKKIKNIGGFSNLTRYINLLAGNASYIPTTSSTAVVLPVAASPYFQVQNWFNGTTTGFNGKYANPATLPPIYISGSSWSRAKGYLSVSYTSSAPYFSVYTFSDSTGFGSKYSDATNGPTGSGNDISLDLDNGIIGVAHDTSPYLSIYPFTGSGGLGTKYANPSSLMTSNGTGIKVGPDVIFVSSNSSPFINAYTFNTTTGIGTKYSDPASIPTYGGKTVAVHPSGQAVGHGYLSGPYIYAWSNITGFGSKYASPTPNPYAYSLRFSSTGNTVAMGDNGGSPYLNVFPFSIASGYGTKYSDPATIPTAPPYWNALAFSYNATAIAVLSQTSPYVFAYAFTEGSGFGSKYSDPSAPLATGTFTGGINFN